MHSSKLELQNEAEFMYLDSKAVQKFGTLYIVLPQPCLASSPRKATVTLSKVILLLKAKQGLWSKLRIFVVYFLLYGEITM